jgi:hypothetical protein
MNVCVGAFAILMVSPGYCLRLRDRPDNRWTTLPTTDDCRGRCFYCQRRYNSHYGADVDLNTIAGVTILIGHGRGRIGGQFLSTFLPVGPFYISVPTWGIARKSLPVYGLDCQSAWRLLRSRYQRIGHGRDSPGYCGRAGRFRILLRVCAQSRCDPSMEQWKLIAGSHWK